MEKQAELIREKDDLDRLTAEMKLEDEDKKRQYANKHLQHSVDNALQLGSYFIFSRLATYVTQREELSLKHSFISILIYFGPNFSAAFPEIITGVSVPAAKGSSAQHTRPTCALRWSSRSSSAARRELRPKRSIGRGRRRTSCTDGGRTSCCPGLSQTAGAADIPSDRQRGPALSPRPVFSQAQWNSQ